jgi:hypothetical protein
MRSRARIPLVHRVPNPPAIFVGREAEIGELVRATQRAAVTVVSGPPGVGKTSLVLAALHGPLAENCGATLYVEAPGVEPLTSAILRPLAELEGVAQEMDWPALASDRDAAIESIVDLAESRGAWIIVDDLRHSDRLEAAIAIRALGRYARGIE